MTQARAWLHFLPLAALGLSFSTSLSAAEPPGPRAPGGLTRTGPPWCARLMCQRRGSTADVPVSPGSAEGTHLTSPVAVHLGLGAGVFQGPTEEVERWTVQQTSDGSPWGSVLLGPPSYERRRGKIAGPSLSLGVSLEQALAATSSLQWGLEARLSFAATLSVDRGSLLGGFADALVVVHDLPLHLALGPSLGVAVLHMHDELLTLEDPAVIVGGAAVAGLELGEAMPGALELIAHIGKSLTYDETLHQDLQLAFALPL